MPKTRILSLWFPRLGAERLLRTAPHLASVPFAVVRDTGQMQVLSSLSLMASQRGLTLGQPLRDAQAMCPELLTKLQNPQSEATFLSTLRRWAGKFSPWVAEEAPDALNIDLTGCAHLFGGEEKLLVQVVEDCADLGLTACPGIADTLGAAWALARFAGRAPGADRSGDAIDQEARATRSRAVKRRHWERGGAPPSAAQPLVHTSRIAAVGKTHSALGPLPIAALRLEPEVVQSLSRLGLRRVSDLSGQPRAALARRFGKGLVLRLDQAFGSAPEPISPAKPDISFSTRLTLPEPIGLESDMQAAVDRLLPPLCDALRRAGQAARAVRLEAHRTDGTMGWAVVNLARPADVPDRLRPLLYMKINEIEAGFGIDMIRLEVTRAEPTQDRKTTGHLDAAHAVSQRLARNTAIDDLVGRIGARIGMEAITRRHPASSHLPEKAAQVLTAAWSDAAGPWPQPPAARPLLLHRPEPVTAPDTATVPQEFRWRNRTLQAVAATGPERIAPEWWLDDPDWRTGVRDYWQVTTDAGDRLWLYFAHGADMSPGWFCHGSFA
ncbi:Y-family DNA polymerase [Pseudaestuariivita atlantica]|uniref:DNA methylase n=1 Tax=Pseudaestuariivita atlantica TaxID=1317121 RepID=A0A0L1JNH5_9RHOB|nr:DNA polymerase Y family protein [Pseudaestuariivita atlantica]KNG93309.1 DNA methylase [Pseudaestuariivita atlantica]